TLVIMAAGIGSRFGGGIKQLEAVGPNGEIIMDYSIFDAMEAGFDKVVFVIRKDLEKDFKEIIGDRISKVVEVEYAFQEVGNVPQQYVDLFSSRTKPWGTGQAILSCKDIVNEPFLVINADDYYGKEAYQEAYKALVSDDTNTEKLEISMVGFVLGNTLSENGGVTRGICKVNNQNMLTEIIETKNIIQTTQGAAIKNENDIVEIDVMAPVSMNMWGLTPRFIEILDKGFTEFLSELKEGDVSSEYLLPTIIGDLLEQSMLQVKVLKSNDRWFGVTYKEDKESVVESIRELIENGTYVKKLFE
ncbi:MAG: sugar phosphate nucleotidyltransferase, partial [Eubacteriales bacterium]